MHFVVTSFAKAYQVITFESQFWIFVIVLDMVYSCCFSLPAVSFALSAHISVSAQYRRTFCFPCGACVEIFHLSHCIAVIVASEEAKRLIGRLTAVYRHITSDMVTAVGIEPTSRARCSCCDDADVGSVRRD